MKKAEEEDLPKAVEEMPDNDEFEIAFYIAANTFIKR